MAPESTTVDADKLQEALRLAKQRVMYLEYLIRARSCAHRWEVFFPSGPRDNGEFYIRCARCGTLSS